ncbi:MAG: sulfotransferase family 2 domain-containing protein [Pseudomonadota bacterium]
MIYSPGRGYLFIHIPKTGGTSLALALEERAQAGDVMAGDTPKAQRRRKRLKGLPAKGRLWKHSTLADLDGWLGADELDQLMIFTIVRNPWDRVVSYYHWLREQSFDHPAVILSKSHDFSGFLNHPHTQASLSAAPYASYVTDATGRECCTRFLRFEQFEDDVAELQRELGVSLTLPHVNQSERTADYRQFYNERDSSLLGSLCSADILRFDYLFDGMIGA